MVIIGSLIDKPAPMTIKDVLITDEQVYYLYNTLNEIPNNI